MNPNNKLALKVLIVSNDEASSSVLADLLSKYVDAISVINNYTQCDVLNDVDLIIIDINNESDKAFIKSVKQDVSVIAIIKKSSTLSIVDLIDAGFLGAVYSPVDFGQIYSLLHCASKLDGALKEKRRYDRIVAEYGKALDGGFIVSKTNPNGIITYVNNTFCKISGYTREELIGKPHNIVRHPKMSSDAFKNLWQTILDKKIWRGRVINRRKDGSSYYVESVISPILDENNNIVEFISMRQDITKMVETNYRLIKEQEAKVLAAKNHYEELEKSKFMLLSLFSHELKTPLNVVINFSKIIFRKIDFAVNEAEKESVRELMRHIIEGAEKIQKMICDIVDVMKLQANAIILNPCKMSVKKLILDKIQEDFFDKRVTFDLCDNASEVVFDKIYANKILENIYDNARKYAKSSILVSYVEQGGKFTLSIEDDGVGFTNPNMEIGLLKQNDKHFLTRQSEGIGIGLYYSKLCAELIGWELGIGNNCDKLRGACVRISGNLK